MKTIVLGYDSSSEARRALDRAEELARALAARVLVMSVAPVMSFTGRGIGPYDPADPPERHRALAKDAASRLAEHGVDAKPVTGLGDPAEALIELAKVERADLIVLGMSHHPHIARVFGGVSEDVVHHARCDVLLVH